MKKYVNLIDKNKLKFLLLIIVMNVVAVIGILNINLSVSFDVFTPRNSVYLDIIDEVESEFNSTETLSVVIESEGEFDLSDLEAFTRVSDHLQALNGVRAVNGPRTQGNAPFEQIMNQYNGLGKFNPIIEKDGKTYGLFQVLINSDFVEADISRIEEIIEDENLEYYIAGDLYMQQKVFDYIFSILTRIPPIALLLILIVFNTQIRNIKATLISVMPAGLAAIWTMGIVGLTGTEVSLVTVLAPIFAIVIGSADGLHFVSHVQEARSEGLNKLDSIAQTLKMVGIPMIITTITSVGGFLALLAINTDAIASFAFFASVGIALAGFATWLVHPLVLTTNIDITSKKRKNERKSYIKLIWGLPSVLIALILLNVAFFSYPNISTEFNQLMIYKEDTDVQKSFNKILEVNDGAVPVSMLVKSDESLFSYDSAKEVMRVTEELEQLESVSKVLSPFDMIMGMLAQTGSAEYPKDPRVLGVISKDFPPQIKLITTDDYTKMLILIYPKDFSNQTLDEISNVVDGSSMDIKVTGSSYLMRDLNSELAVGQLNSSIIALVAIFILMLISLRSLVIAFIATVPIIVTVIFMYGFLGLSGISLNIITATIFSITIGVGIDYAVHYTSVFRAYKKEGLSSNDAALKALHYTERPIIANAFGVSIGLSALFVSPLLIHNYVSILMWVSMICSVFLSLSFLPTLLKLTK